MCVEVCQELLDAFEAEEQDFFQNAATGDETWAYLYDPESKFQSKKWCQSFSPRPKKFKATRSTKKVMSTVFWDTEGVNITNILPEGHTSTVKDT